MDTLERAAALADQNKNLPDVTEQRRPGAPIAAVPNSSYTRSAIPATMTQAPDSQRQFYNTPSFQQRFFNALPQAANLSSAPAQSQAQQFARIQATSLTLNDISDSPNYKKVPIEQFDSQGNLVVANFQGPWNASTQYSDGQEVSYQGNVWVATATNTNSTPSAGNPFWELVGPQTLDNVADGSSYGKVVQGALSSGSINLGSASGWVNKNLDHLPDGSTYSKVLGSALSSNAINFGSGGGWVNKNLDYLPDGSTWQRVMGVSGNKTSTASYATGSISSNYTATTGPSAIVFPPGTPTNIVALILSPSAQNSILISGFYQCFWNSPIGAATVTVNLLLNGTVIASYVINAITTTASGQTFAFTIPATYWAGTLAGATVTLQAETTNTTLDTFTGAGTNCYLTVGNFKA